MAERPQEPPRDPAPAGECGYAQVRNYDAKDGLWVIGGKRQVIYARSELSLADQIRAAQRLADE